MTKLALLLSLLASAACVTLDPTTEANIVDRCQEAGRTLRSCTGSIPEDFTESCIADPSEETFALVDELVDSSCGSDYDEKADSLIDDAAFVAICSPVLASASLVSRFRNNGADGINSADKALLRKEFGSLVDEVAIYWNALIVDEWDLGFIDIQFAFDVRAQTLGHRIYIDESYRPGDKAQLKLLAHELTHARQSRGAGGLYPGFAINYCLAFYRSGFDYSSNALEIQARAVAQEFADSHL